MIVAELIKSPERCAQAAINEYMFSDPAIVPGGFEIEQIREWQEACEGADLTPEQTLTSGWLSVEEAFARRRLLESSDDIAGLNAINDSLTKAAERFSAVAEHDSMSVDPLLRAHADIALGGTGLLRVCLGNEDSGQHFKQYLSLQAKAARATLQHLANTGSARSAMMADSLTLLMVASSESRGFVPLPASPRNMSPDVDGFYRWNALFVTKEGEIARVRVANDGPSDMVVIPPSAFDQERFSSASGYGTLEAMIMLQDVIDCVNKDRSKKAVKLFESRCEHYSLVADTTFKLIEGQVPGLVTAGETTQLEPGEWYTTLNPQRHPYKVASERLDDAISPLELALAKGELSVDNAVNLGWMHAEHAMGSLLERRVTAAQIGGDIDRAEDMSNYVLTSTHPEQSPTRHW